MLVQGLLEGSAKKRAALILKYGKDIISNFKALKMKQGNNENETQNLEVNKQKKVKASKDQH